MATVCSKNRKGTIMRRISLVMFALLTAMTLFGCSAPPEVGDFTFDLPEGFSMADITEKSCSIVNSENIQVGGINLTGLRAKDIRKSGSDDFGRYLNDVAWGCEFFSWNGGDRSHPLQYMSMTVTDPDTQQKQEYYRVFFVRKSGVYDMWFDLAQIHRDTVSEFFPIAEAKE